MTRHRLQTADLVFALLVVVITIVRFRILASGGAPATIDAGDWLAHGDALFGSDVRPDSVVYPPLVPLLTKGATAVFGLTSGVALLGAASAAAPAVGFYLTARWCGFGVLALAPAGLLAASVSVGEAAAWGGFPQLIGFGLAPVVLFSLHRTATTWATRDAAVAGVSIMTLAATSHFVLVVTALAALVMITVQIITSAGLPETRRIATTAAIVALPSLWLAPIYVALTDAFANVPRDFNFFNQLTSWADLGQQVEFLYRDLRWLWRSLLIASALGPLLTLRDRHSTGWRLAVAWPVAIACVMIVTREGRFVYFIVPAAAWGLLLTMNAARRRLRHGARNAERPAVVAAAALLTCLVAVQIDSGRDFFEEQRGYYGVLSSDLVSGIETVRNGSEPGAVLAVTSLNDAPFGRWIEAIADRETFYGSPLQWLLFPVDIERAELANALFVPPFPEAEKVAAAAAAGIDLMLIPTRWVFFDERTFDEFTAAHPQAIHYASAELIVIDTAIVVDEMSGG